MMFKLYTCLDSLVSWSEYGQYQHIQCCERLNEGCKPARFTHIRENNGEFSAGYDGQTDIEDALEDNPALRPASMPAIKLPRSVMITAISDNHTAPPSSEGTIVKPKLKKNMAPKKSRNGNIKCSMRSRCSVSARTSPTSRAPMASAT